MKIFSLFKISAALAAGALFFGLARGKPTAADLRDSASQDFDGAGSGGSSGSSELDASFLKFKSRSPLPYQNFSRQKTKAGPFKESIPRMDQIYKEEDVLTTEFMSARRSQPLYRGSRTPPEKVFSAGFDHREGKIHSLSAHKGPGWHDQWISTTPDFDTAVKFNRKGWVYEIYAWGGIDFTEVALRDENSFRFGNDKKAWLEYKQTGGFTRGLLEFLPGGNITEGFGIEREVCFSRPITPRDIKGAWPITSYPYPWDDPDAPITIGKFVPNPNFEPLESNK